MSEININIRHQLLIALGTYKKCHDVIDRIYEENEHRYYQAYMNSAMRNDCLKEMFSLSNVESINKLIGILEYCYDSNSFLLIEEIIKAVNPSIIRYCKKSHDANFNVFMEKFYGADGYMKMSEHTIFVLGTAVFYLCTLYQKDCNGSMLFHVFSYWNMLCEGLQRHYEFSNQIHFNKFSDEIKQMYKRYDINISDETIILDCVLDNIIDNETVKIMTEKHGAFRVQNQLISHDEYRCARSQSFEQGISKYIGAMSGLFSHYGLDSNTLFTYSVDSKFFDSIFYECANASKYNGIKESELDFMVISSIYIVTLLNMYKQAKDLYLNKSKEDKFLYLSEYETKLKEEHEKLNDSIKQNNSLHEKSQKEIKQLTESKKIVESECAVLNSEIRKLKAENERIQNQLTEQQEYIDSLEELLSSTDKVSDDTLNVDMSSDDIIKFINDNQFKIALFGGHNTTRSALENSINNILLFDKKSADISSIIDVDYVFMNTDWFSHSLGAKTLSFCKRNNIKTYYIGGTNLKVVLNQIYDALSNEVATENH